MEFKSLIIRVLFISLLINLSFGLDYCNPEIKSILAFNLGRFVFIFDEESVNNIWQFDSENSILFDQKLEISSIFSGNTLISVDAAVGFNFNRCKVGGKPHETYCEKIIPARNLVLAIGQKFQTASLPPNVVYFAYRMESDNTPELSLIEYEREMVWGLKTQGSLTDSFWIKDGAPLRYESMVFVPQRTELYASVKSSDGKHTLYLKKMDNNGEWSEWTRIKDIGFIGMFCIRGRVFGMDGDNMITEFIWTRNKLEFEINANTREFFNCYQNSTLTQYKSSTKDGHIVDPLNSGQTNNGITISGDEQAGNNHMITKKPDSKANTSSLLIIIIIIIVLFVVIVFAILLWICLRKRKSKSGETLESSIQSVRSLDDSKITALNAKSSKMSKKQSSMSGRNKKSDKNSKIDAASKETIRSKF